MFVPLLTVCRNLMHVLSKKRRSGEWLGVVGGGGGGGGGMFRMLCYIRTVHSVIPLARHSKISMFWDFSELYTHHTW